MVESLIAAGASGLGMASPVALAVQGLYGVAAMVGSTVVAGGVALNTYTLNSKRNNPINDLINTMVPCHFPSVSLCCNTIKVLSHNR